jgi:hypothetical protein
MQEQEFMDMFNEIKCIITQRSIEFQKTVKKVLKK